MFNAGQVEGYAPPAPPVIDTPEILTGIDAFVAAIENGGTVACYIPGRALVQMPPRESFFATSMSTATEANQLSRPCTNEDNGRHAAFATRQTYSLSILALARTLRTGVWQGKIAADFKGTRLA